MGCGEIVDDPGGHGKAEASGDEGGGAEAELAIKLFGAVARVRFLEAYSTIAMRVADRLGREHAGNVKLLFMA